MLTAKCPYCDVVIHCGTDCKVVECSNCGEHVTREEFMFIDDGEAFVDFELENAKSLRSIAMMLQAIAVGYLKGYALDDPLGPLDG